MGARADILNTELSILQLGKSAKETAEKLSKQGEEVEKTEAFKAASKVRDLYPNN